MRGRAHEGARLGEEDLLWKQQGLGTVRTPKYQICDDLARVFAKAWPEHSSSLFFSQAHTRDWSVSTPQFELCSSVSATRVLTDRLSACWCQANSS